MDRRGIKSIQIEYEARLLEAFDRNNDNKYASIMLRNGVAITDAGKAPFT